MLVGETLDGRYQILAKLGEGGMGEVYLVDNLYLHRREALKVLGASLADDVELARRLLREGRAAGRLNHPNIVAGYDLGQLSNGSFFLTMELVEGPTVADEIRRCEGLPLVEALDILAQLTGAVAHAHQRGVVHRDLKPENLVLTPRANGAALVKVLDFGIAKIVASDYMTAGLTKDGQVFGTPEYMAPESFSGDPTNHRVDLYAIGCIAYELVVGRPPFEGSPLRITASHLEQAPPVPSMSVLELPPELDALVARCMAKDPGERYQTAAELLLAIRAIPGFDEQPRRRAPVAEPTPARPMRARRSHEEDSDEERTFADDSSADALAQTRQLSAQDLAPVHQTTIRQLCELLLALDDGQRSLQQRFLALRDAERERARCDLALRELDEATLRIDGELRAKENELRAKMDELRDAAGGASPTLAPQLAALDERLAALWSDAEQRTQRLSDQLIDLTAAQAEIEDRVLAIYAELSAAAEEALPRFAQHPRVAPVAVRLQQLNQMLASASAGRS